MARRSGPIGGVDLGPRSFNERNVAVAAVRSAAAETQKRSQSDARFRAWHVSAGSAGSAGRVERVDVGFPCLAQLTSLRLACSVPVLAGEVVCAVRG
jgi:hypothetical protein